jgi:hypothetical protein
MRAARVGPLLGLLAAGVRAAPIRLHPDNPRYFLYEGRALALITATEHFGGIINLDFNFERYFKALGAHNFTLAQAWTGAYVEPDADVGPNNTLDPKLGRYIAPWARSSVPGNAKGGNKFDLTKFNQTFFERLVDFVDAAAAHGVVVELGLFGGYEQTHEFIWEVCPFHPSNNVNLQPGSVNRTTVYSLEAPASLRAVQAATVREIARALRGRDNVYYQLVNVPNHSSPEWGAPIYQQLVAEDPHKMVAVPAEWSRAPGARSLGGVKVISVMSAVCRLGLCRAQVRVRLPIAPGR